MADRITDALRGATPQGMTAQPPPMTPDGQQDGTAASGYVTPDLGPFECENCGKFQPPGQCTDQRVVSDPEVQGQVDPQGCCNFFQSAHNENQADEHSEGGEGTNEG